MLQKLIWPAWNNGSWNQSGSGYGIKIPLKDRGLYFKPSWETVVIEFPTEAGLMDVEVNVRKNSFWTPTCREVISKQIGLWLKKKRLGRWPHGKPPRLEIVPVRRRRFRCVGLLDNEQ